MVNISEIFKTEGLTYFGREKFSLDNYKPSIYQDLDEEIDSNEVFEYPYKKRSFRNIKILDKDPGVFKYFLDGSRKVYVIGEFITDDDKYLPIIAGQVATACCVRSQRKIKTYRILRENVIIIPSSMKPLKMKRIKTEILNKLKNSKINFSTQWKVDEYNLYGIDDNQNSRIEDKGTAKIQEIMHSYEVAMVHELAKTKVLQDDSMLIIDGSLQFERQKVKMEPEYFRNVISIAKSFDPHKTKLLKRKSKEIGAFLTNLQFGQRTPVFKVIKNHHKYGAWYIRIKNSKYLQNPLDGIIKVEKLAIDNRENRYGFDSDIIDDLSSYILMERNPTCYGKDNRWSSHLYPIYLTEKRMKSGFLSDTFFLSLFS